MIRAVVASMLLAFFSSYTYATERVTIRDESNNSDLVIFVHGWSGSAEETWGQFLPLLERDPDLTHWDIVSWGYPSDMFGGDPQIHKLGHYLRTELRLLAPRYKSLVIVGHSMGGLVVRAAVVSALQDGQGEQLNPLKHVVLFGVPNEGVDKASYVPSFISRQVADMKRTSSFIDALRRDWVIHVTSATTNDEHYRRIPTTSIAGLEDEFVSYESVMSFFSDCAVTEGDHRSMVKPDTRAHSSYRLLKDILLNADDNASSPTATVGATAGSETGGTYEGAIEIQAGDGSVISVNQKGGITAHSVNIAGLPDGRCELEQLSLTPDNTGGFESVSRLSVHPAGLVVPNLYLEIRAAWIDDKMELEEVFDVFPERSGMFVLGLTGIRRGYAFTNIPNASGAYQLRIHAKTAEPIKIEYDLR